MVTKNEVLQALAERRLDLASRGVRRLGLFGSVARGEGRPESDLDFLVELDRKSFDRYMDLKIYLEDLFGCRVDLVLWDRLRPELRERVLAEVIDAA